MRIPGRGSLDLSEGFWDWWGETRSEGAHLIGVLFLKEACTASLETRAHCISLNNHCYFQRVPMNCTQGAGGEAHWMLWGVGRSWAGCQSVSLGQCRVALML